MTLQVPHATVFSSPLERYDKHYTLIDTAGVRKRKKISDVPEKFSVVKTLQAIEDCNVVLYVVDARHWRL